MGNNQWIAIIMMALALKGVCVQETTEAWNFAGSLRNTFRVWSMSSHAHLTNLMEREREREGEGNLAFNQKRQSGWGWWSQSTFIDEVVDVRVSEEEQFGSEVSFLSLCNAIWVFLFCGDDDDVSFVFIFYFIFLSLMSCVHSDKGQGQKTT